MEKECDVDFLGQMVDSMADAVDKLAGFKGDERTEEKLKVFILKLQKKIGEVCND